MKKRKVKCLKKKEYQKGLPPLGNIIGCYKVGSRVVIKPNCYDIKNCPCRKYFGKVGTVQEIRNKRHYVWIRNSSASSSMINTTFAHLRELNA